jgi:uncharacterized membrane protein YhaH (DUF805 family)
MFDLLKRWLNPTRPTDRARFTLIQVAGLIIEGFLRRWIWIEEGATRLLLVACVLLLLALLAIATAKRLLDVGWPRAWSFLILGPGLFEILTGLGRANSPFLKEAAIVSAVSFVGYLALVTVLFLKKPSAPPVTL